MFRRQKIVKQNNPAVYQIVVYGTISQTVREQLGGLQILNKIGADDSKRTVLTGEFIDQAALHGVLNKLHNLRLPIISVNQLNHSQE